MVVAVGDIELGTHGSKSGCSGRQLDRTNADGDTLRVREVWADNLEDEMQVGARSAATLFSRWPSPAFEPCLAFLVIVQLIRDIVEDFPYLAMDTEFPGVVARPVGNFKNSGEYHYQTLR